VAQERAAHLLILSRDPLRAPWPLAGASDCSASRAIAERAQPFRGVCDLIDPEGPNAAEWLMAGGPITLIWTLASVMPGVAAQPGESTRLRREIGLLPGAAANMVGLAYIAAAQQRSDDAQALLDEASAIAEASQAHRILRQVTQARAELSDQHTRRPS
jgi:hypothetical protein